MAKESKFWNKRTLITALIVILMVSSTAGYMFGREQSASSKYNGYKFTQVQNGWIAKIEGNDVFFNFHPLELEEMEIPENTAEVLDVPQIYLTFEIGKNLQYIDLIRYEFITALENNFNTYVTSGVVNETDAYDFPLIDCVNATSEFPVIKFSYSNETKVSIEDFCVIATAQSELEFLAITDKILYKLFGVI